MRESYIARNADVAARRLGDEVVIFRPDDGELFNLNPQAALVWMAADGRTRLDEIVRSTVWREYDVDLERATADAEALVAELVEAGLMRVAAEPLED
jgi:hypothetical protein